MAKRVIFLLLFAALGVFLIVLPDVVRRTTDWGELSKGIGYALFIVAGLEVMETVLGTVLKEKSETLGEESGLQEIFPTRNEAELEIARKLRNGKKIKILATCLSGFSAMYHEMLTENLAERVEKASEDDPVRIILMSPDADGLYHRAVIDRRETFDRKSDQHFAQWKASIRFITGLEDRYRGSISVRLNPYQPIDSAFIIDNDLYLTPYLYGRRGTMAPCYYFARKGKRPVYDLYDRAFEQFWTHLDQLAPKLADNARG